MKRFLRHLAVGVAVAALALQAACAHAPAVQFVPCRVEQIARPVFPMDRLQQGADIHTQVKTLLADREERKGYEGKLEAANRGCP